MESDPAAVTNPPPGPPHEGDGDDDDGDYDDEDEDLLGDEEQSQDTESRGLNNKQTPDNQGGQQTRGSGTPLANRMSGTKTCGVMGQGVRNTSVNKFQVLMDMDMLSSDEEEQGYQKN